MQRVLAFAFLMTAGALPAAGHGATGKQANRLIHNGVIVFSRDTSGGRGQETSNLYTISPTGGAARLLIGGNVVDGAAAWSPDGSKLAFDRFRRVNGNLVEKLVVANADGSNVHEIADGSEPVWSPDGREIAFQSPITPNHPPRIYVIHPDGGGKRRLSSRRISDASSPAWSPDGRRLAFFGRRTPLADDFVYVVGENGLGEHRLTSVHADGFAGAPAWSPGGKLVAFAGCICRYTKLILAGTDGGKTRTLLALPSASAGYIDSIAWSPNGKTIAFDSGEGGPTELPFSVYVVRSNGLGMKRVRRLALGPRWSPDGRELLFSASYRNYQFEIVNSRGRFLRRIDRSTTNDYSPVWQPLP